VSSTDPPGPEVPGPPIAHKYATLFQDTEIFSGPHKRLGTGKIRKRKSTVTITAEKKRWVRTFPDQWLPRKGIVPRPPAESSLHGIALTPETEYPIALVRRGKHTAVPEPDLSKAARRRLPEDQRVPVRRFSHHKIMDEHPKARKWGPTHVRIADGWINRRAIAILEPQPRPDGIGPDEQWILVDLSDQLAVAYEGDLPVYATVVSTGKRGAETPRGKWKMASKHRSARMAGGTGDSYHFLSDVPWIQYYSGGYAIHAAYWHNGFGWTRSQGCVNMVPRDAQWFFRWTEPILPRGWHSYHADRKGRGTWVVVVR
jgi:hypothetical protein